MSLLVWGKYSCSVISKSSVINFSYYRYPRKPLSLDYKRRLAHLLLRSCNRSIVLIVPSQSWNIGLNFPRKLSSYPRLDARFSVVYVLALDTRIHSGIPLTSFWLCCSVLMRDILPQIRSDVSLNLFFFSARCFLSSLMWTWYFAVLRGVSVNQEINWSMTSNNSASSCMVRKLHKCFFCTL